MKHTFWLFNYFFFAFSFQEYKDAGGQKCGLTREIPFTRIVGGTVAKLGEFPWMASLGSFNEDQKTFFPYCGGSLIGSSYLITAAHCLFGIDGEQTIEEFIAGYANKYLLDKTQSCVKRNQEKVPRLEKKQILSCYYVC